ncbi:hypothetical protein QNA23_10745 [Rhodococcus erythropolis]|uniref:hypothetical protein n=1 Tax=Rhodococcus erythropolis TaxID=1833 RepID=UPI0024B8BF16|nr:hypothetical protein [Rhodococcus erythropolis]MDJ0403960.1 hypothetical protein [Rhodococcus erythropolis]
MTTALRHPHLDHTERTALEAIGVDLDLPHVTITVDWDDKWRHITPVRTLAAPIPQPVQWISWWGETFTRIADPMSCRSLEHGPEPVEENTHEESAGRLDDIADHIAYVLNLAEFDPNVGLTVEVCGWSLREEGHL